jgi:hypothetical protein
MGVMKNLALALEELRRAEVSLLEAANWKLNKQGQWCSPNGEHELPQDEAAQKVKQYWTVKEAD